MSNHTTATAQGPLLPLTVQLGFAGPRHLDRYLPAGPEGIEQLRTELKRVLQELHQTLQLGPKSFFTAISQLAVGADMLFTEAVAELGWPQRIFLPQPRTEFLDAVGSDGPDFVPDQRLQAQALFESPHLIEERVVSTANSRRARFEDTNLRIVEEADLLLCMQVLGAPSAPGGTADLLDRARARKQRVLVLWLRTTGGDGPLLTLDSSGVGGPDLVVAPPRCLQEAGVSPPLQTEGLPALASYVEAVKEAASQRAGTRRTGFRWAAGVVIGTHVAATAIALLALKLGAEAEPIVAGLLLAEVALLLWGYFTHRRLHNEHALRDWAMARLCAEIARSVRSLRGMPVSLDHLRQLALPPELNSLVKTLNVLHLRANRQAPADDLRALSQRYLNERLLDTRSGQAPYYDQQRTRSRRAFQVASAAFGTLSVLALLATASKLLILSLHPPGDWQVWKDLAGPAAILLPVAAVGFMSFAVAMDWEARAHTFEDMHAFVVRQSQHIEGAASLRELAGLASATEARLLGETLSWFGRRAYVGVA